MHNPTRDRILEALRQPANRYATIYIPAPSATGTADQQWDIRVKNALSDLEGADGALMDRAAEALDRADHAGAAARLLVLTDEGLVLDHPMLRPVDRLDVRVGPAPAMLPILEISQVDVPHVAALLDRTGADLYHRIGVADPHEVGQVEGDTFFIHRLQAGGWSQRRYQQTAENTWEHNAKQAAKELVDEFPDVGLIIVGGDVRAVGFFLEHAPSGRTVIEVDGSRSSDHEAFLDNADVVLRNQAAELQVGAVQRAREAVAVGTGAQGDEALTMLTNGLAWTLVVGNDHDADDRPTGRFDFGVPAYLGDVEDWPGAEQPVETPITDGAVMLAARLGTDIIVVPSGAMSDFEHGIVTIER